MKHWILATLLISLSYLTQAQSAKVVKLDEFTEYIAAPSKKVKVINFWATWCAPCVKELPLFEKLGQERADDVEVTLVSMDMDLNPNPDRVYKFVERKGLQSQVLILDERNPTEWINKIDEQWSGALPATIVLNPTTGQRIFVEKELHDGELEELIKKIL